MSNFDSITVKSGAGNYEVLFYKSFSDLVDLPILHENYIIICDENIYEKYKLKINSIFNKPIYIVKSSESAKTLEGIQLFSEWLVQNSVSKRTKLIAIGGGVIQDIATFTAHIFYRGIDLVFFPTTLLSQSDSCIGAKCGINLLHYKNQLGVFHSPESVFIVEEFLSSLPEPDFVSGFGEILKLSVTGPNQFFTQLVDYLQNNRFSRDKILPIIKLSLLSKLLIIEEDEYESDLRRVLNYGHSFGHSLESLANNLVSHGHAVLFGMDIINYLGFNWGITSKSYYEKFKNILIDHFSEFTLPTNINAEKLISGLKNDKKTDGSFINFAIPVDFGEIIIRKVEIDSNLLNQVNEYLSGNSVFRTA